MPIINYLQFLLIGLHFHQCLTNIKHFASKGNLQIPSVQTTSYGKNAFVYTVIRTWNDIQNDLQGNSCCFGSAIQELPSDRY